MTGPTAAPARSEPAGQPHVLLVEDDPQVRLAVRWTLEAEGYAVDAATTGHEALGLAATRPPHVVLLDMGLPDIPGHEVASRLRAAHGDIPILVLTADTHAAQKAARVGAVAYLTKPFESEDLVAEVSRAISAS